MARAEDDSINDKPMPLLEHLIELRRRLIWSVATFLVCFLVAYYFAGALYFFLAEPLADVLRQQGNPDPHLIYTQLYEAFFTKIKVAFFGGAFVAFPMIATQIWLFVAPGLYRSEKRAFMPFLVATPARHWRITSSFLLPGASLPAFRTQRPAAAYQSNCCRASASTWIW